MRRPRRLGAAVSLGIALAVDTCERTTPELVELAPRHSAACHVAAAREGRGDAAVAGVR